MLKCLFVFHTGHVFPEFKESDAMFAAERVSVLCEKYIILHQVKVNVVLHLYLVPVSFVAFHLSVIFAVCGVGPRLG